jgi:hypothetical protein
MRKLIWLTVDRLLAQGNSPNGLPQLTVGANDNAPGVKAITKAQLNAWRLRVGSNWQHDGLVFHPTSANHRTAPGSSTASTKP